ncbi:hypothetical protein ZWY2020_051584 [Hordeum vulgare]|nr:hypothetical protein ZWY2020_051584 [Hordeum vulgare]
MGSGATRWVQEMRTFLDEGGAGPDSSPSASGRKPSGGRKPAQTSSKSATVRKAGETAVARGRVGQRHRDKLLRQACDLAGHPHRFLRPSAGRKRGERWDR